MFVWGFLDEKQFSHQYIDEQNNQDLFFILHILSIHVSY